MENQSENQNLLKRKRFHVRKLGEIETGFTQFAVNQGDNSKSKLHHSTDDSEVEDQKKLEDGLKRARRTKKESIGRGFKCEKCDISYLSYPALYTHNRNKHNIIPITKKQGIFNKQDSKEKNGKKFRYSAFNENINFQKLSTHILTIMNEILEEFYLNPKSVIYNEKFSMDSYGLIKHVQNFRNCKNNKVLIPKHKSSSVDLVLVTYLFLIVAVSVDEVFITNVIKFIVLLREYLNMSGWEHKKYLQSYGILNNYVITGEYSTTNSADEIPELFDDFVEIFLGLDEDNIWQIERKNIIDLIENLSNWMYINELTNFKLLNGTDKVEEFI